MKSEINPDCNAVSGIVCAHLDRLYLQAYILTASQDAASECVLEAFDSLQNLFVVSPAFVYEAVKLATIKSALRRVASEIRNPATYASVNSDLLSNHNSDLRLFALEQIGREKLLPSILKQNSFHRALLLLSFYEGFRTRAVSLLLRLPMNVIERGKINAIESLMASIHTQENYIAGGGFSPKWMTLQTSSDTVQLQP